MKAGVYSLGVLLNGKAIKDSPFKVTVAAGEASAAESSADGAGLESVVAGETGEFIVTARGKKEENWQELERCCNV